MSASRTTLSLRDVTVQFGGIRACDGITVDVHHGELLAVIGPNGAGKTTLLNSITGVYTPLPSSSIEFTDRSGSTHQLIGRKPHLTARLGVARTFQNLGLFPGMSVIENLMLGRYAHQSTSVLGAACFSRRAVRSELDQREAAERVLALLGVEEHRWELAGSLPYGRQKLVELGRVLALEPEILLLDEPMAGMSFDEKQEVLELVLRARRALDMTILLIEHDMPVVMAAADRVLVMSFGQQLALGTPDEVERDPAVVDAYLGTG